MLNKIRVIPKSAAIHFTATKRQTRNRIATPADRECDYGSKRFARRLFSEDLASASSIFTLRPHAAGQRTIEIADRVDAVFPNRFNIRRPPESVSDVSSTHSPFLRPARDGGYPVLTSSSCSVEISTLIAETFPSIACSCILDWTARSANLARSADHYGRSRHSHAVNRRARLNWALTSRLNIVCDCAKRPPYLDNWRPQIRWLRYPAAPRVHSVGADWAALVPRNLNAQAVMHCQYSIVW